MATITVDNNRNNNNPNFTSDPLLQDESFGTQITGTTADDGNEVDVTLSSGSLTGGLASAFLSYLNGKLSVTQKQFVADNDAASSNTNFITATPGASETITDLFFTADPNNATGLISGVTTLNNELLYLHIDSNNNFAYVTTASDSSGRLVAAFALYSESVSNTGVYTAGVQTATFEPLFHTDPAQADEPINWTDVLRVAAGTKIEINFNAVPSGDYLWVAAGSSDAGVLVTSDNIHVDGNEKKTNANEDIHTSKGGGQVTIGIVNQLFDHDGETAVMTLVKHLNSLSTAAGAGGDSLVDPNPNDNKVEGIDYGLANNTDAYLNTNGAGIYLSQSQGTPTDPKDLDINVFRADADPNTAGLQPEEGAAYDDGLASDTPVNVATVSIYNGAALVGTWVAGADPDGAGPLLGSGALAPNSNVRVTITGNNIDVNGVNVNYTINWTVTAGQTFNRFTVTNENYDQNLDSYYNANNDHVGAFDIGKILINDSQLVSTGLGSHLFVEDSSPTQSSATAQVAVGEDALNSSTEPSDLSVGIPDSGDAKTDEATFTAASISAIINAGTDQPAIISFNSSFNGTQAVKVVTNNGLVNLFSHGDQVYFNSVSANEIDGVANGRVVFRLTTVKDANNVVTGYLFDLEDQLDHPDASGENANLTVDLTSAFKMTDKDLDPITLTGSVITALVENDVPAAAPNVTVTHEVQEDALAGGNTPDTGDSETKSVTATISSADLNSLVTSGADENMTFSLNTATSGIGALIGTNVMTTGDVIVQSGGVNVTWAAGTTAGTLRGITTVGSTVTTIFTLAPSGSNFLFTLVDQVDHSGANNDQELLHLDLTKAFLGVDYDKDPVTLNNDSVVMDVENDLPRFSAQIVSVTIDQGSSTPVSNSLNGLPGADQPAHYTIDKYADLAGYIEVLSQDKQTLNYYKDVNGQQGDLAFRLQVSDTNTIANPANNGGMYTFTNFLPAPQEKQHFDFTYFPSGSHLYGVLIDADEQSDLTPDSGLFVSGRNITLNSSGGMVTAGGATDVIHTSQGGQGPVTIGVNDQMFKAGAGAVFAYLDHPDRNSTATADKNDGLTSTTADDADSLGFQGTIETNKASIEVVQLQGSEITGMKITAYDLADDGAQTAAADPLGGITKKNASDDVGTARGWMDSQYSNGDGNSSGDILHSATEVKISTINVYDTGSSTPKATFSINTVTGAVVDNDPNDGISVDADQDNDGVYDDVVVYGFQTLDTIEWTTTAVHDAVLIEGVSGAWDVGGFNIEQGLDAPDTDLSFSVAITDKDGDVYRGLDSTWDDFTIKLDGTGQYNDPNNIAPSAFGSSYDIV